MPDPRARPPGTLSAERPCAWGFGGARRHRRRRQQRDTVDSALRGAPEDGCLGQLTPCDRGQGPGAELPFVSSPICVPGAADTAALCGLQCFLSFEAKLGQE